MKMDKPVSEGNDKNLANKVRMRRWLLIGGFAVGAQALLSIFTHPDSYYYIFQFVIAFFCIGYGLSMTSQIRKLSGSEGEKK
jgi:hypothetical protein